MRHSLSLYLISTFASLSMGFICNASGSPGDVSGRDLAVPGISSFGHIAMKTGESSCRKVNGRWVCESYVLEVLNEGSVIAKNTFSNFRHRSRPWSPNETRYYASCQRCDHSWRSVINAGWAQREFRPQYTATAQYTEGKWLYVNGIRTMQRSKFRCDTFVTYSYRKGKNLNMIASPMLPRKVWLKFPYDYSWDIGV